MRNFLITVIASATLLLVAACDDASQSNAKLDGVKKAPSSTAQAATTTATVAQVEPKKTVWPPAPEGEIVLASNKLQTNIMVVYDGSGSMDYEACGASGNRHSAAVPAVKAFVDAVPADASLGLLAFDSRGISIRSELAVNNKDQFNDALDHIKIGSGTPLKTAMTKAYYALLAQAQKQLGYGRYIMLVVTDGEASSGENPAGVVNFLVEDTTIEVHTVGLCLSGSHSLNQPGITFFTDAQNPDQLVDGLKSALAEANEDDVSFDEVQ